MNFILTLCERLSTSISIKGLYPTGNSGNWTSSLLCLNLSTANPEFDGTALGEDLTYERDFCLNVIDALSLLNTKLTMEICTKTQGMI